MQPEEGSTLYIFSLPSQSSLGKNEKDFSFVNVRKSKFGRDGFEPNDDDLFFAPVGKLGILSGGLLHMEDLQVALSADDIRKPLSREHQAHS